MTRIVATHYRYKPPPRKRKAVPIEGPAVVTPKRKRALPPIAGEKFEPASAIVRKAKPCNDNRPDVVPQNEPAAMHKMPDDNPKPTIVTTRQ